MIFTAAVAKNYKDLFDDLSRKLTVKCLKFLFDTTTSGGDICALIKETVDNFPGANLDILRELIDVGSATLELPGISKQKPGIESYFNFLTNPIYMLFCRLG